MSLTDYAPKPPELTVSTLLFRWKYAESKKHERRPGVVWITDLVSCPLKRKLSEMYPELSEADPFNPVTLEGDIVHIGLEKLLKDIYGDRFQAEVEGEKKVSGVTVRGRIDGLIDKVYGIEIKSVKGDYRTPHTHHVMQALLEMWLFDLLEVEIVYVSRDSVLSYIVSDRVNRPEWSENYILKDRLTDNDVAKMIADNTAPRYPEFECRYCSFAFCCPAKVSGR